MSQPEGQHLSLGGPRPRPIPELLETAAGVYKERFAEFYALAVATLLVSWILNQLVTLWAVGGLTFGALEDPRAPEFLHTVAHLFGAGLVNGMVYAVINGVAVAVFTIVVAGRSLRRIGMGEAFRLAGPRLAPLTGATLLFFLIMACLVGLTGLAAGVPALGGLAATLAGGAASIALGVLAALVSAVMLGGFGLLILYLTLRWLLYPQVVVLEGMGPLEALRRSMALTRDPRGTRLIDRYLVRALALMLSLVVLQVVVGLVGAVPAYTIALLLGRAGGLPEIGSDVSILNPTGMPLYLLIPSEILSVFLSAVVLPFGVTVFVVLFEELRARAGHGAPAGAAQVTGASRQPPYDGGMS